MAPALKEWPAAIHALNTGDMVLLFRKGGIHEKKFNFAKPQHRTFLFPSFAHQKNDCLKASSIQPVQGYPLETPIPITSWVEFQDCIELKTADIIPALSSYHVWTDDYLRQRFQWKPERPLFCILCRTYQLHEPAIIPYHQNHEGCRSWIDLKQDLSFFPCTSILSDHDFEQKAKIIKDLLER